MARMKARPTRASRGARGSQVPDLFTVGRWLLRPEAIGVLLLVATAAFVPSLMPVGGALPAVRDTLVAALGVHVFTAIAVTALVGGALGLRRTAWLHPHARHPVGILMLTMWSAGVLGLWHPATTVGGTSLATHSAGGQLGVALTSSLGAGLVWFVTLPLGFALLWPRTTGTALRATPGATATLLRWAWQSLLGLGLHRYAGRALVRARHNACVGLGRVLRARPWRSQRPGVYAQPIEVLAGPAAPSLLVVPEDKGLDAYGEADATDDLDDDIEEEQPPRRRGRDPKVRVQLPMDMEGAASEWRHSADGWQLPPLALLKAHVPVASEAPDNQLRAQLIVDTLASFGVDSRVTQINEGPTVTQFGVEPGWDIRTRMVIERDLAGQPLLDAEGRARTKETEVSRTRIRVNRITALHNDLALALATPAVRIEAPVPGKSVVGIEVPNATAGIVTLRDVMESPRLRQAAEEFALPIALGSGVTGEPAVADLATMPHVLIAGATGSGKSVCLNAIITCLLMNRSPEQLRLVLIDPKRVELTTFEAIPHLAFSNIIVDMEKVVGALQAVIHEMEARYRRFAQVGVRNIKRYNEITEHGKLPYWVVVIDELADLMMAAPVQVEQQLVRLAQLSRATGIHLVVATQRPSVDVVTGLIKANFPTRIAFAMSSQVDSRTVLDTGGAEKLLGRGDMLYVPTDAQKPVRLQGVYVSDGEIEAVVAFWSDGRFREIAPEKHDDLLNEAERALEAAAEEPEEDDPMMVKAIELARQHQRMSTSMLQRRLRIGYPRAARIMDDLELRGVVGAPDGSGGSREVIPDLAVADAAEDEDALALIGEEERPQGL